MAVLDLATLDDAATDLPPFDYAKGVSHMIANGTPVIDHSEHTGARPGRILLCS